MNTKEPIDISLSFSADKNAASAWFVEPVKIEPVINELFTGNVAKGGSVNFNNITFNPHGNGTHTECVGHITPEFYSVNKLLKEYWFKALLISVLPQKLKENTDYGIAGDLVILNADIEKKINNTDAQAIIIRTLPNNVNKKNKQYSQTNPCYLEPQAAAILSKHFNHLLIDLPSVDREEDNGKLMAHKAFWQYPHNTQFHKTITELIFVPNEVADGEFMLNLMIAPFENDASPSKPVLYKI